MRILLIRHAMTAGNLQKRYVGSTDEPITKEADTFLREFRENEKNGWFYRRFGVPSVIFTSPMRRCLETAALLFPEAAFPGTERKIVSDFSECRFGRFEYKTYLELSDDPDYKRFLELGGKCGFPEGEAPEEFKARTVSAFRKEIASVKKDGLAVFVVHGGTIMAILEAFAVPFRDYFSWQSKNLCGYAGCLTDGSDGPQIRNLAKIEIL